MRTSSTLLSSTRCPRMSRSRRSRISPSVPPAVRSLLSRFHRRSSPPPRSPNLRANTGSSAGLSHGPGFPWLPPSSYSSSSFAMPQQPLAKNPPQPKNPPPPPPPPLGPPPPPPFPATASNEQQPATTLTRRNAAP